MIKRSYNRNDLLGDLLSAGTAYGAGHLTTMSGVGDAFGEYFADRERGGTGDAAAGKVRSAMKDPTTLGAIGLRTGNILSNALNAPGGHGLATPITQYFLDIALRRQGEKLFPGIEHNPYMRGTTAALSALGARTLMRGFDTAWDAIHEPKRPTMTPSSSKPEDQDVGIQVRG